VDYILGLLALLGFLIGAVTALWAGFTFLNLVWNLLLLACRRLAIRFGQDMEIKWLPPINYFVACATLLILLSVFLPSR